MQGEKPQAVDAIAAGVPEAAGLAPRELALLDYVKLLTQSPHLVTDAATQKLREVFKIQNLVAATEEEYQGLGKLLRDVYGFDL